MAYERTSDSKLRGEGLDVFVENQLNQFTRQLAIRNAQDETKFNQLVLEQNLSLEDQLSYRKEQKLRVADDPAEERRIQKEISTLKDRIEQKTFSDAFNQKLIEFESGMSNIESVISWLETRRAATTDIEIRSSIDEELLKKKTEQFNMKQNILKNQTDFAVKDKTQTILDEQIGRVQSAKNQALLSGNDELISSYDLQLQSLQQAKAEADVEDTVRNFSIAAMAGYQKATDLLNAYNDKINTASADAPVTIGGVRYSSAKEFWTLKRNEYLADESASGFFNRFKSEQDSIVNTRHSQGLLTNELVRLTTQNFNNLSSRIELQGYEFKIEQTRQEFVQDATDLRAKAILNEYERTLDVNKSFSQLSQLKELGANVDDAMTTLITRAGEVKQNQVSNILATTEAIMAADPSKTASQAIEEAIAAGAGAVISPEQAVAKSEKELAEEAKTGAEQGSFQEDPRTTAPDEEITPQRVPGVSTEGEELSKSGRFGAFGTDVFEVERLRKLSSADDPNSEFKTQGLNFNLLPQIRLVQPEGYAETFAITDAGTFRHIKTEDELIGAFGEDARSKVELIDPEEAKKKGLQFSTKL